VVQALYGGLLLKELQTSPLQSTSCETQVPPGQLLDIVQVRPLRDPPEHVLGWAIMQLVQVLLA